MDKFVEAEGDVGGGETDRTNAADRGELDESAGRAIVDVVANAAFAFKLEITSKFCH